MISKPITFYRLLAVVLFAGSAFAGDTVYVDFSGIDTLDVDPPLSEAQKEELKGLIIADMQANFDVAGVDIEVTDDDAQADSADRTVNVNDATGTHQNQDGSTGYHYGSWEHGSDECDVNLGNFFDRHGDDYQDDEGNWDLDKLRKGIGRTAAHEIAHSYSVGHNDDGESPNKMTEGGLVSSSTRANTEWIFDQHTADVMNENLGKDPCETTADYDEDYLVPVFFEGPMFVNLDPTGDPYADLDEYGYFDARLYIEGPLALEFDLGWYGRDTDGGVEDGNAEFDFIYKASMAELEPPEMLTFFELAHATAQFVLRGRAGSGYDGLWFPMSQADITMSNAVVTPAGDEVYRRVLIKWELTGDSYNDVIVTLSTVDAYPESVTYNGWQRGGVWRCFGDLNYDLEVGLADLAQLLGNYDTRYGMLYEDGDLDGDRDVDLVDLATMLSAYTKICPPVALGTNCEYPIRLALSSADLPYVDGNTTCGMANDYSETCLGAADESSDIVYELTLTESMELLVVLDPMGTGETGMLLSDVCPPGGVCLASAQEQQGNPYCMQCPGLDAGTYYLMVDSCATAACIREFVLRVEALQVPENDFCENAAPIGEVEKLGFETFAATFDGPGYCMTSPNVWYCYTPTCTGMATVTTAGSRFNTALGVYVGCGCQPTDFLLGCAYVDDWKPARLDFPVRAGEQYMIEVGALSPDVTGQGKLTVKCGSAECIPPGQDCWTTLGGKSRFSFVGNPIPADFFDPGSEPFSGTIYVEGGSDPVDTVIERIDELCFGSWLPFEGEATIQLKELDLVSSVPIAVVTNGGLVYWDVQVGLSGPQPLGTLAATLEHGGGGTFTTTFSLVPVLTFTRVDPPYDTRILDFAAAGRPPIVMSMEEESFWSFNEAYELCSIDGFAAGITEGPWGTPCGMEHCWLDGVGEIFRHCVHPPACPLCPENWKPGDCPPGI